jgi:ABC-type dipeptide/oligopeptide/nickel transport system ATPase subunit
MLPSIIGLLGRSRSGKDTVASIIQQLFPTQQYSIVRLSTPIKEASRHLFDFNEEQIEGHRKEVIDPRWGITPRQVFQTITSDTMKYMGTDFFTKLLYEKYEQGVLGKHIIIPDIRYMHDIEEIQKRGGIVLKIERTNLPISYECENHLDSIQNIPILQNNSTMEELKKHVRQYFKDTLNKS